jgi:hypothetical protein
VIATETTNDPTKTEVALFSVSDNAIAEIAEEARKIGPADDRGGYLATIKMIAKTRGLRGDIEKRRVTLKADALAWGRKVDGEAGRLTKQLLEIEEPLKQKKAAVDDAKERERRAAEDAERLRVEEQARAHREAEDKRLEAERERQRAEDERQRQEREKLLAVRDQLAAEQAEVERKRQALEAEQRRVAAEEKARLDKIRADEQAVEAAARAELERAQAERRQAALAPDREKLLAFAAQVRALTGPEWMTTEEGERALAEALKGLADTAHYLETVL